MTKEELLKAIDELASRGYIKNFSDEELDSKLQAYEMYVDEIITNRLCPYNKNELML